jgi:hypothetical protein
VDLNAMPTGRLKTANDSSRAAAIRRAIGAGPTEMVHVMTPQFARPKGWTKPGRPPRGKGFETLRTMSETALRKLGLHAWGRRDEHPDGTETGPVLMLFPGEWYDAIPAGFAIVDICFREKRFIHGFTDRDIRGGCLPFGVYAKE